MDNISIFNNAAIIWLRKIPHRIIIWLIIVILAMFTMTAIFFFFNYDQTKIFTGIVQQKDDSYYISILVPEKEVDKLIDKKLMIDNNEQTYKITNISNDYYLDNNISYREVNIETNLPINHIINNNQLELKFIINKTTLYQQFKERIKKGLI